MASRSSGVVPPDCEAPRPPGALLDSHQGGWCPGQLGIAASKGHTYELAAGPHGRLTWPVSSARTQVLGQCGCHRAPLFLVSIPGATASLPPTGAQARSWLCPRPVLWAPCSQPGRSGARLISWAGIPPCWPPQVGQLTLSTLGSEPSTVPESFPYRLLSL